MRIRRFSPDHKTRIPGPHRSLYGVPIQLDSAHLPTNDPNILAQRFNGLPILLDNPLSIHALYLDPNGAMDEHSNDVPTLVLIISGSGFVRLGGPTGESSPVSAGDAILWPAHLPHTIWTTTAALTAIVIEEPTERDPSVASPSVTPPPA